MYPICLMKKDKNMILCSLLTIATFMTDKHTNRRSWGLYDQPGPDVNEVDEHILNHESFRKYQHIGYFPNQTGRDGLGLN